MTAPNTIPTAVVQKAAQGDADAQSWLYHQFSKAMFNICTRMTGNLPHAEDILQDAFITAFKNLHALKDPAAFGGWLKRIVVNGCISHCKKNVAFAELVEEQHEAIADEPTGWWTMINITDVHREIKKLPEGCRQIFVLYAMEDNSHSEIAALLGISEGTSKSQYHRARKLLRERINSTVTIYG